MSTNTKPSTFAPSANAQRALDPDGLAGYTETRSTLFACVARTLGFPIQINIATEVRKGSPTGRRQHTIAIPRTQKMVCFNGHTHVLRSNGLQMGLKQPSKRERLCLLDDTHPEHPALYMAQAILNYRAIQRSIHEGAPLYQFKWLHTSRTSLINDANFHPFAYLIDEMEVTCGKLAGRHAEMLVSLPDAPTEIDLVGTSEKHVTALVPQAVAMSTMGFDLVPHIIDRSRGKSLFVLSKEATCSSTCLMEGDDLVPKRKWTADQILDLMVAPSCEGRNNAMEDCDPEHPIMYGAFAIMTMEDLTDIIRKGPNKGADQIKFTADGTMKHAYAGENNRDAMDRLRKMFRRSGRFSQETKLL